MTQLLDLIKKSLSSARAAELAADAADDSSDDQIIAYTDAMTNLLGYYDAVLQRANQIMDKDKTMVFADVLNLTTRGQVERAMIAYDSGYLLGLGLSLESTAELAEELIQLLKPWKLPVPKDWEDMSKSKTSIGEVQTKIKHVRQSMDM